jgi:hypothetical protein
MYLTFHWPPGMAWSELKLGDVSRTGSARIVSRAQAADRGSRPKRWAEARGSGRRGWAHLMARANGASRA